MKEILTGSRLFFDGLEGFEPKDTDVIVFVEKSDVNFNYQRQLIKGGKDTFEVVKKPKEVLINSAMCGSTRKLGMFLTPEAAKELGITIDDLVSLRPVAEKLDLRHKYQGVILEAYIANGNFVLTDEQRKEAFEVYKEARVKHNDKSKGKGKK